MAILTFDMEEGWVDGFSEDGERLSYTLLFSKRRGWLHCEQAMRHLHRIRDIEMGEAAPLANFFLQGRCLSSFQQRMSPEDWSRILAGVSDREYAQA